LFDKGFNPRPGCVIDTDITYGNKKDFFLVSHQTLKGTARPTHYVELDRYKFDNVQLDEIKQMTYSLCYIFPRSRRLGWALHPFTPG
jgi:eukaryotic translation initiation factor 2C